VTQNRLDPFLYSQVHTSVFFSATVSLRAKRSLGRHLKSQTKKTDSAN